MRREKLIARRKELGLKQKDIAQLIGCTTSAYGLYEQGVRNPSIKVAQAIAKILNSTVEDLFFDTKNNKLLYSEKTSQGDPELVSFILSQ